MAKQHLGEDRAKEWTVENAGYLDISNPIKFGILVGTYNGKTGTNVGTRNTG